MIRFLIILAILILALSFFGISIRSIVESPTGHDNFLFIWQLLVTGWHTLVNWTQHLLETIHAALPETSA